MDTRTALENLRELVSVSNLYLRDNKVLNIILLHDIAKYITNLLTIFGAVSKLTTIGFPLSASSNMNV